MNTQSDPRQRVLEELDRRNLSVRKAAQAGGVTNTVWGDFLNGGKMTKGVRESVARAFGWELDWPDNPPLAPEQREDELKVLLRLVLDRLGELEAKVDRLER